MEEAGANRQGVGVVAMESKTKKCTATETKVAEMLLAPEAVPAKVTTHVAACEPCGKELEELRATMALLDGWEAPEPSPYFLTRLEARLNEERRAAPAGWFERLRARLTYGPQLHARPIAAMALTVVLLLGGGTYLGITNWNSTPPPQAAVVHDLQLLDNNAQLLDQLEALSSNDSSNAN
jgi:hypothetical protein